MLESDAHILIVDDEPMLLGMLSTALSRHGFRVTTAADLRGAEQKIEATRFDLVLTDTFLSRQADGLMVLKLARAQALPPVVLLMSGQAQIQLAVDAMRNGAEDFLEKPIDPAALIVRIERALETGAMRRKLTLLEAAEQERGAPVAVSQAMRNVLDLADRVAASPASSALILGESGVGKEVIASRIHRMSRRKCGPFVRVNLAAMPESMVEADLFGSVRGAFTDSKRDRPGLLATAHGGTILLDELCEFRAELQPKLLRVLEERSFFPVGSDHERSIDIRVLASTNRNPTEAMASGRLRADLYYRLSTMTIEIPPLRSRPEDILPLAERFLQQLSAEFGRAHAHLTQRAEERLLQHDWRGNVRELRNSIERALMLSDSDVIDERALLLAPLAARLPSPVPPQVGTVSGAPDDRSTARPLPGMKQEALETMEREQIARALRETQGNRARAAKLLGLSRTTLWEKAKRYGIGRDPSDE